MTRTYRYQMPGLLILLLLGSSLFRYFFEMHTLPMLFYFDQMHINLKDSFWYTYMIPTNAKAWGGTMASFSIGILPILHKLIGITKTYLLFNLLFISLVYTLSWYTFHSRILTFTVGLCAAFTTLNNHTYENGSLVALYVPLIFCFLNLFSIFKLFETKSPKSYWWYLWFISLFFYIGSFEGWVDYYATILILSPALIYILKKNGDLVRYKRLMLLIAYMTLAFIPFLYVKIKYVYASNAGNEHDLIFNYGPHYLILIIEDFISNFFTFFYTTIITYLPRQMTFSNALLDYGDNNIIALQSNYDAYSSLAALNALFMWRFYAGVYLTLFIYYFWKVCKRLFKNFNINYFFLFIFMAMILIGSPSHMLIKFRSFHIVPWLPYQLFIGQIGLMLLISYGLYMLHQSKRSKKCIWTISILTWCCIVMSAFTKPPFYQAGKAYGFISHYCKKP